MRKLFSAFLIVLVLICMSGCKNKTFYETGKENVTSDKSEPISVSEDESSASSKNESDTSSISSATNSTATSTTTAESVVSSTVSSTESETGSKENESEDYEEVESTVELVGVNKLRPDYDLGDCRDLSGDITVIIFYLDDFESSWTSDEMTHFTEKEIKPGLKFLEDSAREFDISLNLKIEEIHSSIYYEEEVEVNVKESGYATGDALYTAAEHLGYKSDMDLISNYKTKYSTEIICYCIFNKEGNSYALNPKRGVTIELSEHVLMFSHDINSSGYEPEGWQSSVIAHETLHLYGAEDYYKPDKRKALAQKYYPNDIMLSCKYYLWMNNLCDVTAFYVGWTDNAPSVLYEEDWQDEV